MGKKAYASDESKAWRPLAEDFDAVCAIIDATDEHGCSFSHIEEKLGVSNRRARRLMAEFRAQNIRPWKGSTKIVYFANEAFKAAHRFRAEMGLEEMRAYWRKREEERRKRPIRARRGPGIDVNVTIKSRLLVADGPAIIPPSVRVTRAEKPKDRFGVEPGFVGSFMQEWNQRRSKHERAE